MCDVTRLNKCVNFDHISRENEPLVKMSANCLEVLTYLFWMSGSKFILSNNQSKFALWVREMCLMDGLRPLMIILITASLSSKTNKDACLLERWAFGGAWSILSVNLLSNMRDVVFLGLVLRTRFLSVGSCSTSVTMSHKLRAGIPSNLGPASHELISASVLLCETAVCFLQVQLIGTNVRLPKMHDIPRDLDFLSQSGHLQNRRPGGKDLACIPMQCFPHDNLV